MVRRAGVLDLSIFGLYCLVPETVFVCVCDSVAKRLEVVDGLGDYRPIPGSALPPPGTPVRLCAVAAKFPLHGDRVEGKRFHAQGWQLACLQRPRGAPAACWYPAQMAAIPPSPGPLKVLIVEDNRDARTTLRMLLTLAHGHDVIEADDGAAALQIALDERPDVALIDLGLPGLDGLEVARRIRAVRGRDEIYLVALTGYGEQEDRRRAEAAGFDVHFVKPVDISALAKLLGEVAAARI
jgi:CheY-like chemotaxis protein